MKTKRKVLLSFILKLFCLVFLGITMSPIHFTYWNGLIGFTMGVGLAKLEALNAEYNLFTKIILSSMTLLDERTTKMKIKFIYCGEYNENI